MNHILTTFDRYQDHAFTIKGLSPITLVKQKQVIKQFIKTTNAISLQDVSEVRIEHYLISQKKNRNWSAKTILNVIQTMYSFFEYCLSKQYIKENPVAGIDKPKLPKRLPKSLSLEQSITLIEWAKTTPLYFTKERKRTIAIFAMFLHTGIRKGELLNLKISDVNLKERTLFIEQGKGAKDRLLPINWKLEKILTEYLKDRSDKKTGFFFASLRKDIRMNDSCLKRLFERVNKENTFRVYPHLLRHTFATLMLQNGCNLMSLSTMMGHTDIKTTTIYLSITTSHLQEQVAKHPLAF